MRKSVLLDHLLHQTPTSHWGPTPVEKRSFLARFRLGRSKDVSRSGGAWSAREQIPRKQDVSHRRRSPTRELTFSSPPNPSRAQRFPTAKQPRRRARAGASIVPIPSPSRAHCIAQTAPLEDPLPDGWGELSV